MGTRERQEREREIVRRAIIDAARELFVAEGFAKVSMRKIADRIEYSPAAIYSYFPSKDDIFFALAEEGFQLLCQDVNKRQGAEPVDIVREGLRAFYRFSQAHPEYYALMFLDRSVPNLKESGDRIPMFREAVERMIAAAEQCMDQGIFARQDPRSLFKVLITGIQGVATTSVCGRLLPGQNGDALAHDLIEIMIAGLRTGITLTFVAMPLPDAAPQAGTPGDSSEPVGS